MPTVPFSAEAYEGLAETHGLLRLESNVLVMEYQTQDGVFGVVKSDPKTLRIQLDYLEEAVFKAGGWFGKSKLTLRLSSMQEVGKMPGAKGSEVQLKVDKKYNDAAYLFMEELEALIKGTPRIQDADDPTLSA